MQMTSLSPRVIWLEQRSLLAVTLDTPAAKSALASEEVRLDQSEELIVSTGEPVKVLKVMAPPEALDKVSKLARLSLSLAPRVTSIFAKVWGTRI